MKKMNCLGILVVVSVQVVLSQAKVDRYCAICTNHTMCQFSTTGPACKDMGSGGVTESEKSLILDRHNFYRSKVAGGYETRGTKGPQPSGANMQQLEWDDELAAISQMWADQCLYQHDTCRHVGRFRVGQNLYWSWHSPKNHHVNWTGAIDAWYIEVELYDHNEVSSYKFDAETGHYTQMIWADTNKIGCGRRNYGLEKLYVCNYGPAGNWIRSPMYLIGEPCSKCPSGYSCDNNLCTKSGKNSNNLFRSAVPDQPEKTTQQVEEILTPPKQNAENVYNNPEKNTFESEEIKSADVPSISQLSLFDGSSYTQIPFKPEVETTTGVPQLQENLIPDDLTTADFGPEINKEVLELQEKIKDLVRRILARGRQMYG